MCPSYVYALAIPHKTQHTICQCAITTNTLTVLCNYSVLHFISLFCGYFSNNVDGLILAATQIQEDNG